MFIVDFFRISVTPKNKGLLSSITHPSGDIDVSHDVNAYSPSIVLSGDTPLGRWISISTSLAVLSSIFFILIFPVSLALTIESINDEVVVEYGISVITSVFLFNWLILALIFTLPPLIPSL